MHKGGAAQTSGQGKFDSTAQWIRAVEARTQPERMTRFRLGPAFGESVGVPQREGGNVELRVGPLLPRLCERTLCVVRLGPEDAALARLPSLVLEGERDKLLLP